jgi:DnaK suppressor protein
VEGNMTRNKTERYFRNLLTRMLEERSVMEEKRDEALKAHEKRPDPMDWAVQERDREMNLRIRERDCSLLEDIVKALTRIERGTYGICLSCEDEIGIERLKANPMTRLCIACRRKTEARSKSRLRMQMRQPGEIDEAWMGLT